MCSSDLFPSHDNNLIDDEIIEYLKEERALIFGKGVDKRREIIDKALELGIIEKGGGGFFTLPGGNTIRGFSALYNISNEILKEIQSLIEK